MKGKTAQLETALRAPGETRLFLLHGPDVAGSRALAKRVAAAAGDGAERVDLTGLELKADPARLADEAAALSLFGGSRYIIVEPAGEEALAAVDALLEAPVAGNPVAIVAGVLKPTSKLLQRVIDSPAALAVASFVPEGRDAARLALDLAREQGLMLSQDLAGRIAEAAAGNRAIIAAELEKLALYLDAAPERPRALDEEDVDAVGAANGEGDLGRLVDSVGGGDAEALQAELARLASEGIVGIPLLRAMLRRMMTLARLRAEVERGSSPAAVMASQGKSVWKKEQPGVSAQLPRWRSELIAKGVGRLLEAERQVKAPGAVGTVAVDEELFAICRQAARLR